MQSLSSSECFIAVTCLRINVVPNHPQLPMLPQDQLHHFPARIIGPEHTCPLRSPIISCSCFIGFNAVFLNHPHLMLCILMSKLQFKFLPEPPFPSSINNFLALAFMDHIVPRLTILPLSSHYLLLNVLLQ